MGSSGVMRAAAIGAAAALSLGGAGTGLAAARGPARVRPPALLDCRAAASPQTCLEAQRLFIRRDWPQAQLGLIEAADDVALCLSQARACGVRPDRVGGCAWGLAVATSGSDDVDAVQTRHAQERCAGLAPGQVRQARARAAALLRALPPFHQPED